MIITSTKILSEQQKKQIFLLWNAEYPEQLGFSALRDFDNYLRVSDKPAHILAINESDEVIGWAFSFQRENERWFAIIVDGKNQKMRLGTTLLNQLKKSEKTLNGWVTDHNNYKKTDGTFYLSPQDFYRKNEFIFCNEIRLETEKLSAVKISWNSK